MLVSLCLANCLPVCPEKRKPEVVNSDGGGRVVHLVSWLLFSFPRAVTFFFHYRRQLGCFLLLSIYLVGTWRCGAVVDERTQH